METAHQGLDLAKLPNEDLRRVAVEGGDDAVDVIVELADLPSQRVEFRKRDHEHSHAFLPSRIADELSEQRDLIEDRIARTRKFPHGDPWTGAPAPCRRREPSSCARSGEQLRQIASSPLVKAVRPNRQLR